MSENPQEPVNKEPGDFERAAASKPLGLTAEFLLFLKEHKAWWMVPILLSLVLIGAAVWMSTSTLAPFIYPLF
ncbi:DUF5989 family protein [Rubinisphaera sp.]|uniref:DUF5989 family protein n=1 Tax=Rubinisphaera sp. TaxID=2024857 RepID=UPI000C0C7C28|nr:DUF5989 family protein [Rubinisphaera sp.]MBV11528.1 hypothetical protein [Rubinisphaera sp.]HCS52961.1 hypothetical protein [Planctomycetaceae bacterium]|tara:strand:+ start:1039 stop:1257 length:219 start_codon:yes stop_codon:yes gene_type:complete